MEIWAPTGSPRHAYLEPKIILPTSNNPGAYAYYAQQVGTSAVIRPAQFCQTVGCVTSDGSVAWINVGNANLYGLGSERVLHHLREHRFAPRL